MIWATEIRVQKKKYIFFPQEHVLTCEMCKHRGPSKAVSGRMLARVTLESLSVTLKEGVFLYFFYWHSLTWVVIFTCKFYLNVSIICFSNV